MPTNKPKSIIALNAPVAVTAAEVTDGKKSPPKFSAEFYTGVAMEIEGWELPVVIDLAGLEQGKTLVANLDHDSSKRVGNFAVANDGKSLVANGTASARTTARDEVVGSAEDGYEWQASLEVRPRDVEEVKKGQTAEANGRTFEGPVYITRTGTLKGFAFVSHGADDNTSVSIAAIAASPKEHKMDGELKSFIETMLPGTDVESLSAEAVANLEANYKGQQPKKKPRKLDEALDAKQTEFERVDAITEIALKACDNRPYHISEIKKLAAEAVDSKWTVEKFRLELLEASIPMSQGMFRTKTPNDLNGRVLEAAICQAGRLPEIGKHYNDQEQQIAHDKFKGTIGLRQLLLMAAEANGHRNGYSQEVTIDVQRAAFRMKSPMEIHATGFSTIDIDTIISNVANKFIMRGWNMVDQTALQIAKIQNVRDFKTATTVSLTDSVRYEQVGASGEIKHGTLGELSYTNQANTYAKMLAITRQDIINDDLGALTDVPMKLGNGAIKLLNHIFWTEFLGLVSASFFASGNSNINTAVADMTEGGLDATYVIFKNQTNPDGTPLGVEPKILLVPTALEGKAKRLMASESFVTGITTLQGSSNIWANRFTVLSSPYISNSTYTGNTAVAWWMLADPNELPVIAIAALNGRVEPTVETADADFNVLGIQMRGYSDVGVNEQEYRGGVHADGGAS